MNVAVLVIVDPTESAPEEIARQVVAALTAPPLGGLLVWTPRQSIDPPLPLVPIPHWQVKVPLAYRDGPEKGAKTLGFLKPGDIINEFLRGGADGNWIGHDRGWSYCGNGYMEKLEKVECPPLKP